jgi:hypothetical protein
MSTPNYVYLNKLASILEDFREERKELQHVVKRFDLTSWGTATIKALPIAGKKAPKIISEGACGTSACAFGTAALHPWFQKRGLKPRFRYAREDNDNDNDAIIKDFEVYFKRKEGFEAAQSFFDISYKESRYLFDPGEYSDNRQSASYVAKRIRSFVKHKKEGTKINHNLFKEKPMVDEYKFARWGW